MYVVDVANSQKDSRGLIMPHQQQAVDALDKYFNLDNPTEAQAGLIVMPTGSGKTYTTVTWLLQSCIPRGYRIIWFAHRQELINQTFNEFKKSAPLLQPHGIKRLALVPVSSMHRPLAESGKDDITICSILSAASNNGLRLIRHMVGKKGRKKLVVVIDEAHHAPMPSYQDVLNSIKKINPATIVLGLTATPTRTGKWDRQKLNEMFNVTSNKESHPDTTPEGYIYLAKLKNLIQHGFLSQPYYHRVNTNIVGEDEYHLTDEDYAACSKFGDLSEAVLGRIAQSAVRNKLIVDRYLNHRAEYGKTLIFAINQDHAETLCQHLNENGVQADYVISGKPGTHETIERFRHNEFPVLVNVQIMTEGTDVPDIQTVFLTRQTSSDGLLMQMVGRGLRGEQAGGTKIAHIVDFHDIWGRLDPWFENTDWGQFNAVVIGKPPGDDDDDDDDNDLEKNPISDDPPPEEPPLGDPPPQVWEKLYSLVSQRVKSNLVEDNLADRQSVGWYEILRPDGRDDTMLVFDDQLDGYERIAADLSRVSKWPLAYICGLAFGEETAFWPNEKDLRDLLATAVKAQAWPELRTFAERDAVLPAAIAKKLAAMFPHAVLKNENGQYQTLDGEIIAAEEAAGRRKINFEEIAEQLRHIYDENSLLRSLYKDFYMFRKSVELAIRAKGTGWIERVDERDEYHLVPDYYDLNELLDELWLESPTGVPLFFDKVLCVMWSRKVVRTWYAQCYGMPNSDGSDYRCVIRVNKLLSSPDIEEGGGRELIKYLLYHELLHASGLWRHDKNFRAKEWKYPNSAEYDAFLDSLSSRYKLDIPALKHEYDEKGIKIVDILGKAGYGGLENSDILPPADGNEKTDHSVLPPTDKAKDEHSGEPTSPAGGTQTPPAAENAPEPPDDERESRFNPEAPGVKAGFKYCRNCGNRLPEKSRFCDKCGESTIYEEA